MQFRLLGFDIRLDITFLFIGILFYGLFTTLGLVLFLVVSGLTVLMHELGHAIVARRVGGEVLSVNLQGFGGFTAWLPNDGVSVMQRFWVAAAGPLYQLALGAALYAVVLAGVLGEPWTDLVGNPLDWRALQLADLNGNWGIFIVLALAILSVVWAIFNLIPIFGLDGYTMVRQLAFRATPENGDAIARVIGLVVSVGLITFFVIRGAIFGALWVGYIAFSNYPSARKQAARDVLAGELQAPAAEEQASAPDYDSGFDPPSLFEPPESSD